MKTKLLLSLLMLFCSLTAINAQVILYEDFNVSSNTTTLPTGWISTASNPATGSTTQGCHSTDWEQVTSGGFVCPTAPYPNPVANAGTGMAGYNSWDIYSGEWADLATPALNFSGLGTITVDFYVYEEPGWNSDSLSVWINTSPTSAGGTLLASYTPYNGAGSYVWSHYTINIPTTFNGTTNHIIFRGVSDYGLDIFVDDVTVTRIPPTPCAGTPQTPSITNTAMTAPLCSGSTATLNAIDPNIPTTSGITYQWETSATGSAPWTPVTGGSGGTTLNFTTPTLTSSAWYRMALTCAASTTTIYTTDYLVQVGAPQPSIISGPGTFCPGDPATYTVTAATGTTYTWTLPSGWSGTSTTNSITGIPVGSGGAPVTVSVTATDACGTSVPRTLTLSPGSAPATPTGISGNALFCPNTSQTYSVTPVSGALSYVWSLPSGWVGSSTTNTITATNTISAGTITLNAVNGCGSSPTTTLAVAPLNTLGAAGTIYGKDTVCGGVLNTYYIHPVPGATSYSWTLPPGWSGTTTDTLVQVFGGAATGTISVTAYVSCATSPVTSKVITLIPAVVPTVTLSAPASSICEGAVATITANYTGGGTAPGFQWYKNGNAISATGSSLITNTLSAGDILQVVLTSNADCAYPTTATSNSLVPSIIPATIPGININSNPGEAICSGTMVHFASNSTGTGALPGYQWQKNGIDIPGATASSYSANDLNDGDTITVVLMSSASCVPAGGVGSNKIGVIVRDTLVPAANISVSPGNVINVGDEVTFTAIPVNGGATPTYQWIRNGVAIPFATSATYVSSSLKPGDEITVRMYSYLDCAYPRFATSNEITLEGYDLSVGGQSQNGLSLYPNPSNGQLKLKADLSGIRTNGLRAEVTNTIGQVVYRVELYGKSGAMWEANIELPAQLANGQYLLHIRNSGTDSDPVNFVRQFQLMR